MTDDGDTKDDVKVPDGEVGEKILRLFKTEEKDTSESCPHDRVSTTCTDSFDQTLSF
jgi:hypothetical protein